MDYIRLLLLSCPCVDLDKHSVFCRFTGTVCARGTDTFSVLAHSFSPFVSHFDTHFLHLGDSPVLCGSTQSYGTLGGSGQRKKAGFHFRVPVLCDSSTESPAWCSSSQTTELHPSTFLVLASSNFILLHPGTQHHRVTPPIVKLTLTPLAPTSPQGQVSLAG